MAGVPIVSIAIVAIGTLGFTLLLRRERRAAIDVVRDLQASKQESSSPPRPIQSASLKTAGTRKQVVFFLAGLAVPVLVTLFVNPSQIEKAIPFALLGAGLGFIAGRPRQAKHSKKDIRELEFHLPLVMERIVMGVEAGLDVIPAIQAISELEDEQSSEFQSSSDPVTELLKRVTRLTDGGIRFENSLRDIAKEVPCNALRHAFIHLGLAYKEGGELIYPLRELSDSVQIYFQESVENEIAKLPVKATLPLLLTFCGLIIIFLTAPLLQVMDLASKAMPQ